MKNMQHNIVRQILANSVRFYVVCNETCIIQKGDRDGTVVMNLVPDWTLHPPKEKEKRKKPKIN